MVINALRDPSRGVELEQLVVELEAPIELARVRDAFAAAHARHDVLRSVFRWQGAEADGALLQEIARDVPLEVRREVLSPDGLPRWLEADRARDAVNTGSLQGGPRPREHRPSRLELTRPRISWVFGDLSSSTTVTTSKATA